MATADGLVTIAPHFVAQGTIDAFVDNGMAPETVRIEYARVGAEALGKLAPPGFGTDAWFKWIRDAMNRWEANV